MEKKTIIETLRSYVNRDSEFAMQDFEKYDVPRIKENGEPFFWEAYEHGTRLAFVGVTELQECGKIESMRMAVFRDSEWPICSFTRFNHNNSVFLYYDGLELKEIKKTEVSVVFNSLFANYLKELKEAHPEEVRMCNEPLEIKFASAETERLYKEAVEYARSLNDDSLEWCVDRLSQWTRRAINHTFTIYCDFDEHCFTFAEMINGETGVCGGILKSDSKQQNRWSTHT